MRKQISLAKFNWGFTLIELMITVALLALMASIALPSYVQHVRKSHRTEAKTALLDLAGREERLYSTTNAYSTTPSDLGYSGATFPITIGSGGYQVALPTAGWPANTFSFIATPLGSQAKDTDCAQFTLNEKGQQQSFNTSGVDTSAICWQ